MSEQRENRFNNGGGQPIVEAVFKDEAAADPCSRHIPRCSTQCARSRIPRLAR
jgi:hypothetical protein